MNMLPRIAVVIIGVNVGRYIGDCIRSVKEADYPQELINLVYVDGGSTDNSVKEALATGDVKVVELNDAHPTPGRGRNMGWKSSKASLIQFLDADTIVHPSWFKSAVIAMDGDFAAVCGRRKERYPKKNIFHRLTDMEWRYEFGPCRYFGGDVLVKREALEKTYGFDESLVAGEDPDLSYRIRLKGYRILRLDAPMTTHDINMSSPRQYWKRAYRSGYAYAQIGMRYMRWVEKMWLRELIRIVGNVCLQFSILILGSSLGYFKPALAVTALIFLRPVFRLAKIRAAFGESFFISMLYAMHSAVVIYPQFCGVVRYLLGRITGRPLRNKGIIQPVKGAANA